MSNADANDWPKESDDGHEHSFDIDMAVEMDVSNAVMCSKYRLLPIEE